MAAIPSIDAPDDVWPAPCFVIPPMVTVAPRPQLDPYIAPTRTPGVAEARSSRPPEHVEAARPAGIFDAAPLRLAPPEFTDMVTRAGGSPALAERLWTEGIDAEGAIDALTLSMRTPAIRDFPQARLLGEILGQAQAGALSPEQVRGLFRTLGPGVVVRPDGVLARAYDGQPLEARTLGLRGGRLEAGGLPVGGLYAASQGVLREVGPGGQPGAVVDELGLQHDPLNAALDGAEELLIETLRGSAELLYGLAHEPEATLTALVHAAGSLPGQAVKVAFEAPEMIERFKGLPEQDQLRVAAKLLGAALLTTTAVGAARTAGATAGTAGRQLGLRIGLAQTPHGATLAWFQVDGLAAAGAAAGAAGRAAGAAGAAQPILRSRDGDVDDPKVRFANEHHIGRTVGDPRVHGGNIDEIADKLRGLQGAHPNTQRVYARFAREYLDLLGPVRLDDVAQIHRALEGLPKAARAELDVWIHRRFREAIDQLGDRPTPNARARAAEIRSVADDAGVDLHTAFRPMTAAAPRSSLSPAATRALEDIAGGATEVTVASRAVAEEILSQYPHLAQTQRVPKWKTKALLRDEFQNTFHWDDVQGTDGRVLGHGPDNPHGHQPHLQLQDKNRKGELTVFFPWERSQR